MTKKELIKNVMERTGSKKIKDVAEMLEAILGEISMALDNGEQVQIKDFGCFQVVTRKSKTCVNPQTGEKMVVPETERVKFKPYDKCRLYYRKV